MIAHWLSMSTGNIVSIFQDDFSWTPMAGYSVANEAYNAFVLICFCLCRTVGVPSWVQQERIIWQGNFILSVEKQALAKVNEQEQEYKVHCSTPWLSYL